MIEGWHHDDYLVLFGEEELATASERYRIAQWLPGFTVVGLRGWDDFIVRDQEGRHFTVPTVPADPEHLVPFGTPARGADLRHDPRFTGRIKWYIKPVALGGDPQLGENLTWVDHEQHAQLVCWWNDKYRALADGAGGG